MSEHIRLPNGMAPARRTDSGFESSVSLPLDAEGAFGRECPNQACLAYFKVFVEDYGLARARRRLSCPACGHTGDDETFLTPEQVRRTNAAVLELAKSAAQATIAEFVRGQGSGVKRLGKNVSIRYNTSFAPRHIPEPLPEYVERETLRTFTCPNGGHRAVIYDLLAACPYCGPETPPRAIFDDNVAAMRRRLDDAEAMAPRELASGDQTAVVEQSLTRVVAALQSLAKQLHARAGMKSPTGNPWQNVERLQTQWESSVGADPFDGIAVDVVSTLKLGFARRHVLEHNGGFVDARYVDEAGEGRVGQRLRFRAAFVREFIAAAEALANRLTETATQTVEPEMARDRDASQRSMDDHRQAP